jgi:antitoxin CcdA
MRIMRMGAARRVATNLTARADLVRAARELDLNLSEIFERAMVEAVRRKRDEDWLASNREAIDSYNEKVERQGVFSDAWRKF